MTVKYIDIHVRCPGDWDELYFRGYLREHPEIAKEYAVLKLSLKDRFEHDLDAYTEAKGLYPRYNRTGASALRWPVFDAKVVQMACNISAL